MLRTISIEPTNKAIKEQTLPLGYWNGQVYRTLTTDFQIIDHRGYNNQDPKAVPPMTDVIKFNHLNQEYLLQFEDDEELMEKFDKDKKNALALFYGLHTLIQYGENDKDPLWNRNMKVAQYKIVDKTQKSLERIISFEDRAAVTNKVMSMDIGEKRDVCYYFGQSPLDMTDKELNLYLVHHETGYLFITGTMDIIKDKISAFKHTFMSDDPEREFVINIQKAIMLGVIEDRKDGDKHNYYLGATPIGQTQQDVIMYFTKESELYKNAIVGQVQQRDKYKDVTERSVNQFDRLKMSGVQKNLAEIKEKDELKLRAKQLKDEGYIDKWFKWHLATLDNLKKAVAEGEAKKMSIATAK